MFLTLVIMKRKVFLTFFLNFVCCLAWTQITFEDRSIELGLNLSCGYTFLGNGVSISDFNNDGWDDITFTTELNSPLRFFENNNGIFEERFFNFTDAMDQTKQVNWVDIDNDGDKDLFVTSNLSGNKLFENQGNYNLIEITQSSGLPTTNLGTYGASWGDYNNDGLLDVFMCNRDGGAQNPNYLFKNEGNNTFTNVSSEAGIHSENRVSFCAVFFDFNNDGWQDIYVSNDRYDYENVLYKNNGDGSFSDVSFSSKTNIACDAMTVTVGDFNNDSWFDIYVTNSPQGNYLLLNEGDETFTDITYTSGTLFESWSWGAVWLDADNDKDLDLYVSGQYTGNDPDIRSAALYENIGNNTFIEPIDDGFNGDDEASFSNATGDFNNDGLSDIVVTNLNTPVFAWKNESTTSHNWLKIKLQGTVSNRDGIGSTIEISENSLKQYRYVLNGEGYLSQNSAVEIFGLGTSTSVDYIKVTWLSGIEEYFYNIAANQIFEIIEGSGTLNNNVSLKNNLIIHPNPVSDRLFIENNTEFENFVLFNALGQEILRKNNRDFINSIDLRSFNSGVYFIRLFNEHQQLRLKIIKN